MAKQRKYIEIPRPTKKWQRMFRNKEQLEQALKNLVRFVHLVHTLAKRTEYSPDYISDGRGGKIYL